MREKNDWLKAMSRINFSFFFFVNISNMLVLVSKVWAKITNGQVSFAQSLLFVYDYDEMALLIISFLYE